MDQEMVLIPGGSFLMGNEKGFDTGPVHKVALDSFYLDAHEVTNAEYHEFCKATERKLPEFWGMEKYHCGPDFPDHPVVGVSWSDAKAYAEWADKRLPTEAEWEYAARGGVESENYPYGPETDSTKANFSSEGTVAVGSFPPNGFGLYDMSGNVVEWVADYYRQDYYESSPAANPQGPEKARFRVIRGGGWHSGPYCSRVYFRNALPANWVDFNVGFRCARDLQAISDSGDTSGSGE
ncbi:MAG: formylglycine-generating enzyme family protein [Candidatus Zixiibacteriota bacterium]|nr:MAG: formylglycine-generating enzyme family protein [candidate division Zixibacteria bacterium]